MATHGKFTTDHIGSRIRKKRELNGHTRTELANRLGVSHQFLARIEAGVSVPSVDRLLRIASELDVEPSALLWVKRKGSSSLW